MIARRTLLAGAFGSVLAAPLRATEPPVRPAPDPNAVTLWTSAALGTATRDLLRRFEQVSGIRVAVTARGSDIAMAGLYTGHADVALIGRVATDAEKQAFEWVRQYPVAEIVLPVGLPGASPPVRIVVNPRNPLTALTLDQIRMLLLADRPLDWHHFSVTGALGGRAVRVHLPDTDSGTGRFLRAKLADGRSQLAWPRIAEHAGDHAPAAIVQAVALDPAAIGFSGGLAPGTRTVPILVAGAPLLPDAAAYPLARAPFLYLERPLAEARPAVRALVDFLKAVPA